MKLGLKLSLALKLVLRDWRSGELGILLAALIIAVAGSTAVSLFGHRLSLTMETQAAEFLAADLAISSHDPWQASWFEQAKQLPLQQSRTIEFPTVLVENGEMLLTGAKGVSAGYPLRGSVRITDTDLQGESTASGIPAPGTAWVDARILHTLKLKLGDSLSLGLKTLQISHILTHEPDRKGDLYSLSPRLIFNLADLEAAAVIRPGSNVHYFAQFAGDETAVNALKAQIKPNLKPGQKLVDIHEDRPELGNALSRAERYLGLSSTVIVLIAGIAIAMSARRYCERHFDLTALLKCLGARENDVLFIHLAQYLIIGLSASLIGCGLGYLAQAGVAWWLQGILPQALISPRWYAVFYGFGAGLFVLLGFALPSVLRLKRLPPLRVLRRDLAPMPPSAWIIYGLALVSLGLLIWRYTGDGRMTAIVLGIALGILGPASLLVLALLRSLRKLAPHLSLPWRLGLKNLTRTPRLGLSQILAFGLTLTAMLVSLLVRTELVQEWQRQLPAHAPNYFALNLFEQELPAFKSFLQQREIQSSAFFPIVRGRLIAVNGVDVHQIAHKDSQGEGAISRELSLTWSNSLPADNQLIAGRWWQQGESPGSVSVEAKLAESLGIKLGDSLSFSVAGSQWEAKVSSLRSVRWDTLKPNFYMIFPPGSLQDQPATWLTSFYVPEGHKQDLVALAKTFPAMTVLEVEQLVKQFQAILKEITYAIEFVLLFALASGFTVLFASVRATLDERLKEDAILRALGASRKLLLKGLGLEFLALGFIAGLLGVASSEAVAWVLYAKVFDLEARFHWPLWLLAPLFGALAVGGSGFWHVRRVLKVSPLQVFREL